MISSNDDQRVALEKELAQVEFTLQATIKELSEKQVQLKREINDCCPILKIPPEISAQFFMAAFPENSFSTWGSATPFLFGAICHKWRALAWSFPLLWSSVSFTVRNYTNSKNVLLQEWLARSRDLPLSIQLRMREPQRETGVDAVWKDTMEIIAGCSERWRAIDFHLLFMFHSKICSVPTQFPLLVSMSLYRAPLSDMYDSFISKLRGPQEVWDAPKLRHVYVDTALERCPILPLSQLTSFSWLGSSSSQKSLQFLQNNLNLIKCQFKELRASKQLSSVTALPLKTLDVGFQCTSSGDTCSPGFLDSLTLPDLRDLSITEGGYYVLFPTKAFTSFISRSTCQLQRLSLTNMTLPPDQLVECLSATPLLTELQLGRIKVMRKTFKNLTVDETSWNNLLPNLESFSYVHGGYGWYTLDFTGLIMMARSRLHFDPLFSASFQRISKLKTICIDFSKTRVGIYLDSDNKEDAPDGSNEELGKAGDPDERIDSEAAGESPKLNRRLMARFRRLATEGMSVRILGYDGTNLL